MPRQPRMDAPGVLHHVMARGIERRRIFRDDTDRDDFLRRVAALVRDGSWIVYAWSLMPNHFHLFVRTAKRPLPRAMRRLMTGHAVSFNRRHKRCGHLFQNRYKSIVVEEDSYFLELVRYLHLNPARAKLVQDLKELDAYPYSGHSAIVGEVERDWQETVEVLGRFGSREGEARRRYREFMGEGWSLRRRPELMGGGLVRSAGGWGAVRDLRRGREKWASDERVLGSSRYVERLMKEAEARERRRLRARRLSLEEWMERVAGEWGLAVEVLSGGGRSRRVSAARTRLCYRWVEECGGSGAELARRLNMRPQSVYEAAARGREKAEVG